MSTLLHRPDTDATQPVSPADGNPPARSAPPWWRRLALWLLAGVAVFVGAGIGLRVAHAGVLPGTELAGVSIDGMSHEQLQALVADLARSAETEPVTVGFDDHLTSLQPQALGYDYDADATVQAAWALGRGGNPIVDTWAHVTSLWSTQQVVPVDGIDEAALDAAVATIADDIDRQVGDGGLVVDLQTLDVTVDPPTAGYRTEREALGGAIRAALPFAAGRDLTAPVEITPVRIDAAAVRAVAAQAEQTLTADVTLAVDDTTVTLTPAQIAPLLILEVDGSEARLAVSSAAIIDELADLAESLTTEPVDARFDLPSAPPVRLDAKGDTSFEPKPVAAPVVAGVPGRNFDPEVVADAMGTSFRAGNHDVTVDLPLVEPAVTTADLEALNVTSLLGTFTTYYTAGQPRVTNIRHLADVLDGTIVRPGEQFSINRTSGKRTCDKGYAKDGMIYGGELIKVCGGGVSQVGTAVFNAAFFSGVQIDQHKPHSWFISRYPMGREATLDYDTDIDVKFTNDTGNGIVIRTDHSSTQLTVSLYGTSDVERVSAVHGAAHNPREAPVEYVEDPSLPPGTEKVVDSGHDGFDIDVTRVLVRDGETARETWSHRYVTAKKVVHRNSQEPEPSPSPSEPSDGGEPSDGPSPSPSPSPSPTPPAEDDGTDGPLGG